MSFEIELNDQISDTLDALKERIEGVASVVGESAQLVLMEHLAKKDADSGSHKSARELGAEPSGLYADMARSLSHSLGSDQVTLTIDHVAAAMHYYGGTVKPVNYKHLAIPVSAESYNKGLKADYSGQNLLWLFGKNGPWGVALKSKPEEILFVLAKSANIPKNETLLPDDATWITSILSTVSDALGLEAANGQ